MSEKMVNVLHVTSGKPAEFTPVIRCAGLRQSAALEVTGGLFAASLAAKWISRSGYFDLGRTVQVPRDIVGATNQVRGHLGCSATRGTFGGGAFTCFSFSKRANRLHHKV